MLPFMLVVIVTALLPPLIDFGPWVELGVSEN